MQICQALIYFVMTRLAGNMSLLSGAKLMQGLSNEQLRII
jgi:hypothetical protein